MDNRVIAVVLCLYLLCLYSVIILEDMWSAVLCWLLAAGLSIGEVIRSK